MSTRTSLESSRTWAQAHPELFTQHTLEFLDAHRDDDVKVTTHLWYVTLHATPKKTHENAAELANPNARTHRTADTPRMTPPAEYIVTHHGAGVLFVLDGALMAAPRNADRTVILWDECYEVDGLGMEQADRDVCDRANRYFGLPTWGPVPELKDAFYALRLELEDFCAAERLPFVSADEIKPRTPYQAKWLQTYIARWDALEGSAA